MPKFLLPDIDAKTLKEAGSRFITFPPGAKVGDVELREVEVGMLAPDTPGVSMMLPIIVTQEGADFGKQDKISWGVKKDPSTGRSGIWKGKEIYQNVAGKDIPLDENGIANLDSDDLLGKPATGVWQLQKGHKGGDPTAEEVNYPKLIQLLPAGSKPRAEGIF